jgi:acetyl-CoA carboxylase carboxyltransferase component
LDGSVRTYLVNYGGIKYGLFVNPPKRPNLFKTDTIIKYRDALHLFKKLQLPVFSFVDTPGADPRAKENNLGMIKELNKLTVDIMEYPYFKLGIVFGRCYGGASVISFPSFFGGEKAWALENSNIGIMGDQIISKLLSSSKRLHAEWEANAMEERDDLSDYIELEVVEKVLSLENLTNHFKSKLNEVNRAEFLHY